jgi:hypothetical protein
MIIFKSHIIIFFFIDTLKKTSNREKTRTRWKDAYHLSGKRGGSLPLTIGIEGKGEG